MAKQPFYSTESNLLAKMLGVEAGEGPNWNADDLGAILRHQFSAPVQFDLAWFDPGSARQLNTLTAAQGLLLNSFADLMRHPNPPLVLLQMTKNFAKANFNHPDSPLPHDISRVLYFACIAAAWLRCGQRITNLDDSGLRDGWTWVVDQDWVDDGTKKLMEEAIASLETPS